MTSPAPPSPLDSSPSSSSHSALFRPFSRLPTELIQHIIELSVPLSYHSTTYIERQTTLRSLCLVSRLFRQIAQPLLFAVVKIHEMDVISRLEALYISRATTTTTELVLEGFEGRLAGGKHLHSIPATLVGLRSLVVSRFGDKTDISELINLPNLSTLRLAQINISEPSQSFVLAKLLELEILHVASNRPLGEVFNTHSIPSLRALAFYAHGARLEHLEGFLLNLAPQLDMISLDLYLAKQLSLDLLAEISPKMLLDQAIDNHIAKRQFNHLRLYTARYGKDCDKADGIIEDFGKISKSLLNTSPDMMPQLLYLDQATTVHASMSLELKVARDQLDQLARERGIELVFEKQVVDWSLDAGISQNFWRRMRSQRRT